MKVRKNGGFTLIELMIVIAIIGLISALAVVALRNVKSKQNDTRRVSNVGELQKGLQLYIAQVGNYPVYTGCISGSDLVSAELSSKNLVTSGAKLVDPTFPTDPGKCYYYKSASGSQYTLRYTLEATTTAGTAGDHTIVP